MEMTIFDIEDRIHFFEKQHQNELNHKEAFQNRLQLALPMLTAAITGVGYLIFKIDDPLKFGKHESSAIMGISILFAAFGFLFYAILTSKEHRNKKIAAMICVAIAEGFLLKGSFCIYKAHYPIGIAGCYILLGLSMFFLGLSAFSFVESHFGYRYSDVAAPEDIKQYQDTLIAYYGERVTWMDIGDKEFKNYLLDEYVRCASINAIANEKRRNSLFSCNQNLIIAVCCLLISFCVYYTLNLGSDVTRVEITNKGTEIGHSK